MWFESFACRRPHTLWPFIFSTRSCGMLAASELIIIVWYLGRCALASYASPTCILRIECYLSQTSAKSKVRLSYVGCCGDGGCCCDNDINCDTDGYNVHNNNNNNNNDATDDFPDSVDLIHNIHTNLISTRVVLCMCDAMTTVLSRNIFVVYFILLAGRAHVLADKSPTPYEQERTYDGNLCV